MKLYRFTWLLLLVSFSLFALQPVNRMVAVINDEPLNAQELMKKVQFTQKRIQAMGQPLPKESELERNVLDGLIAEHLELQRAEEEGIQIDDAALDDAIARLAKQNNFEIPQFKELIEKEGFVFAEYREDIRKQMRVARLEQRVLSASIQLDDAEVKSVLATLKVPELNTVQYHVYHVVIDKSIPDAEKQANEIVKKVREGKDIHMIVMNKEPNGTQGQDFFETVDGLPSLIANEVTKMRKGEVHGPILTEGGVHVVQLLEMKGEAHKHEVQETEVRHILIKQDSMTEAEVKAKLKQLAAEISHGKSFESVAQANSADIESGKNGGKLGWVRSGQLVPEFEKVMGELAINTLSEPVQTPYGWHLIQVTSRRTIDDTKGYLEQKAREQIYQRKFEEARNTFIKQLRDEAFVQIL